MKRKSTMIAVAAYSLCIHNIAHSTTIAFQNSPGFLAPNTTEMFSEQGQTFMDIGDTLGESFLNGVNLTVYAASSSPSGGVTFTGNGSPILGEDTSLSFHFSAPVTGSIFGHANWSQYTDGVLTFGPSGTIGPGNNAVNFNLLTVDGLKVSNETGGTFFQSQVEFIFTEESNPYVQLNGQSGVIQLEITSVIPEANAAAIPLSIWLSTIALSIYRRKPRN